MLFRSWRQEQLDALHHSLSTSAIWHEDVAALADQKADILVTHEAPHSHPDGAAPLEALARAMGARLIVHGHHHVNYRATAEDGLQAMGVGAAWGVDVAPGAPPPHAARIDPASRLEKAIPVSAIWFRVVTGSVLRAGSCPGSSSW